MPEPMIELVPQRAAVRAGLPTTLDVLLRIVPPLPPADATRPPLNLALVLDRSGSMAGECKMGYARQAAAFAVTELAPTDRVSVVAFDDYIEVPVPNRAATAKGRILAAIAGIESRGSTDLHGGWAEGAKQAQAHPQPAGLNRVLLLSDGLANQGVTQPDAICTAVNRMAAAGVRTTTLGVGDDYNEDLMEAMARGGDGNFYHIEHPDQLPAIFRTELAGLMATVGETVSLGVVPAAGVTLAEVFNDLDTLPNGRFKLPNLISGMPVPLAFRFEVGPAAAGRDLCTFRLAWNATDGTGRRVMTAKLKLPAVPAADWDALLANVDVDEAVALLRTARAKKRSTSLLEQGDHAGARQAMADAHSIVMAAPATADVAAEQAQLAELDRHLDAGEEAKFRKHGKFQVYQRRTGKKGES